MSADATRLVILGAAGDLTARYLLPALAELEAASHLHAATEVVGVTRQDWDDDAFRRHAAQALDRHAPQSLPAGARTALLERLHHLRGDATDARSLEPAVGPASAEGAPGAGRPVVAYLALPPEVFGPAVEALAAAGMAEGSRVVVEKPFGTDLESAQELNAVLHRHNPEESIYRLDHFLGMQTVQNLLGLRFANRVMEPLWCAEHVAGVDIVWDETLTVEGRAGYYDRTGALRDMVQNHLLQVLALVAMERPAGLDGDALSDAKVAALRSVRRLGPDDVARQTARGRYTEGLIGDRQVAAYTDEPDVDPSRGTETFAAVTLFVDDDRWRGVPFRLRSGKALGHDRRFIAVRFRDVERLPFAEPEQPPTNRLVMTMEPDSLDLSLALNGAGELFTLEQAHLRAELTDQDLSAYARLLRDALGGHATLSTRSNEVEEAWRIVGPILDAWAAGASPLVPYPAGSAGL